MKQICDDLMKEHEALDVLVADLGEKDWNIVTPFSGWTIMDEISHLAYFDNTARLSASDQEGFNKHLNEFLEGATSLSAIYEVALNLGKSKGAKGLLEWWRQERKLLIEAFLAIDPKERLPWYGPSMSSRSSATARLMETWAHGQDVADALGIDRPPTERLKNIAHLGFKTFGWSYSTNSMEIPDTPIRLQLAAPNGDKWAWGPEDASNIVSGNALDFCLIIIRRRHVADTDLKIEGPVASEWISIAQAFAGPPEKCPEAGKFQKK